MIQLRPVHKKLRIPQRLVRPVLSRIKVAASRGEHAERLALAREIQQSSPEASSIPEHLGYRRFDAEQFYGIPRVIDRCEELFDRLRSRDLLSERKAGFHHNIAIGYELTVHPELLR